MVLGKSQPQSKETIEKRSESMIGKNLGKEYSRRDRKRAEDVDLPKYLMSYQDSRGRRGYKIKN